MTHFIDTRTGADTGATFSDVVLKGIAPSGGLFVPDTLPTLELSDIIALADLPYAQRAAFVYDRLGIDFTPEETAAIAKASYADNFDTPAIAPVVTVAPGTHVLELWHGPTSAFKDMALQCMPRFFSAALTRKKEAGELTGSMHILVATSGDTGKAALDGFADRAGCRITVLYPATGVSQIQRKQMVTQGGANVAVYGVEGNFDDCQNTVKAVFNDAAFNKRLHAEAGVALSSANSINFGRLMPQIVYYLSAYADLVARGAVAPGAPLDVCVPTGNFGNILGAYYAQRMGAPLGQLICASNENNILTDFLTTGTYDISDRSFIKTPSPSMDILISSNMERLLYHLADAHRVDGWMRDLREQRRFQVDRETFASLRELFAADFITNEETLATIAAVNEQYGYLCDPHTAVAWEVGMRLRDATTPLLVVSTAHWAKFATNVLRALTHTPAGADLPGAYAAHSEFEQLRDIAALAPDAAPVPTPLAALENTPERFSAVIAAGPTEIEARLLG